MHGSNEPSGTPRLLAARRHAPAAHVAIFSRAPASPPTGAASPLPRRSGVTPHSVGCSEARVERRALLGALKPAVPGSAQNGSVEVSERGADGGGAGGGRLERRPQQQRRGPAERVASERDAREGLPGRGATA